MSHVRRSLNNLLGSNFITSYNSYKKGRMEYQNHKPISFSYRQLNFVKILYKRYVFQAKITRSEESTSCADDRTPGNEGEISFEPVRKYFDKKFDEKKQKNEIKT